MKKHLFIIGICILAFLVCVLPFPTRIWTEMKGSKVDTDGKQLGEVFITVEGWQLNYLFRRDALKVTVEITENNTDTVIALETIGPIYRLDSGVNYVVTSGYDSERNYVRFGYLAYAPKFQSLLVTHPENNIYIVSLDESVTAEALRKTFRQFVN